MRKFLLPIVAACTISVPAFAGTVTVGEDVNTAISTLSTGQVLVHVGAAPTQVRLDGTIMNGVSSVLAHGRVDDVNTAIGTAATGQILLQGAFAPGCGTCGRDGVANIDGTVLNAASLVDARVTGTVTTVINTFGTGQILGQLGLANDRVNLDGVVGNAISQVELGED